MGETLGYGALTLPAIVVCDQYAWTAGDASLYLPAPTLSAEASQGTIGDASLELPLAEVTGTAPNTYGLGSLNLPKVSISGMGLVGTVGEATLKLPHVSATGTGSESTIGTASLVVPLVEVSGGSASFTWGKASLSIPLIQVSGEAFISSVGNASLTLPIPSVSGDSGFATTGTASITIPLVLVSGYAEQAVVLIDVDGNSESLTGYALVLNTKNHGLTEYSNYGFNSFAYFNGKYLGASSSGIFDLTNKDDDATKIKAKIRTGLQDGNTALRKGIEDAFLGVSANDALTARVVADGYETFDGSMVNPRKDELVTERVKFGRGIRSRYLGVEIENRSGCDFTIESAELTVVPLTRKM